MLHNLGMPERRPDLVRHQFAARFNQICDEKGVAAKHYGRQTEIAKIFGVSQRAARRWLEGETMPQNWRMIEIARWGTVCAEWLSSGRGPKNLDSMANFDKTMLRPGPLLTRIPVYSWPDLLRISEMDKTAVPISSVPCPVSFKPELFALIMEGDSMIPDYLNGDTLIIDPTVNPLHGDDVIFQDELGRSYLRRLSIESDGRYLIALNPDHPGRKVALSRSGKIFGIVVFSGRARRR